MELIFLNFAGLKPCRGIWPGCKCELFSFTWLACFAFVALLPAAAEQSVLLQSPAHSQYRLEGFVGQRLKAHEQNWLVPLPLANPGMTAIFEWRKRPAFSEIPPYAGGFAGQYLIALSHALPFSADADLRKSGARVASMLIASQAEDGYLGIFSEADRLAEGWDLWGQLQCMLGLLAWHDATQDPQALRASRRAAEWVGRQILEQSVTLSPELETKLRQVIFQLRGKTVQPRMFNLFRSLELFLQSHPEIFSARQNFLEQAGFSCASHSLLQTISARRQAAGEPEYEREFLRQWSQLREIHSIPGVLFGAAPNTQGPNCKRDHCCQLAWMNLTLERLRMSRDSQAADELELAWLNWVAGAQHPSGRWWTFRTDMHGTRLPSILAQRQQAPPGAPELNCCALSSSQGMSLLSQWAVMTTTNGLAVNYYGPGIFQGRLPDNSPVSLQWVTDYPLSGRIELRLELLAPKKFEIYLRIPSWSKKSSLQIGTESIGSIQPGTYVRLYRRWRERDRITLNLDTELRPVFSPDRQQAAFFSGPLLLAWDSAYQSHHEPPSLDESNWLSSKQRVTSNWRHGAAIPWVLVEMSGPDGNIIRLCDFASAGGAGTTYQAFFPCNGNPVKSK